MDLQSAILTVVEIAKRAKINYEDSDTLRAALMKIQQEMFSPQPSQGNDAQDANTEGN